MLVLSRKLGEKIVIGDNICITVVDIDRGKIRLGIEAPRDVPIFRQELLPRKAGEGEPAPATIVKIENGENRNPTIETLQGIANALDVSVDSLIT